MKTKQHIKNSILSQYSQGVIVVEEILATRSNDLEVYARGGYFAYLAEIDGVDEQTILKKAKEKYVAHIQKYTGIFKDAAGGINQGFSSDEIHTSSFWGVQDYVQPEYNIAFLRISILCSESETAQTYKIHYPSTDITQITVNALNKSTVEYSNHHYSIVSSYKADDYFDCVESLFSVKDLNWLIKTRGFEYCILKQLLSSYGLQWDLVSFNKPKDPTEKTPVTFELTEISKLGNLKQNSRIVKLGGDEITCKNFNELKEYFSECICEAMEDGEL